MAPNKPNKLAFLSMPAPASYVAGLGRGLAFTSLMYTLLTFSQSIWVHHPFRYWSCTRGSLCRSRRVSSPASHRVSHISSYVFAAKRKPDEAKTPRLTRSSSKTLITSTGCSQGRHMNKMTRKRTRYTSRSTRRWTHGGEPGGVCFLVSYAYSSAVLLTFRAQGGTGTTRASETPR